MNPVALWILSLFWVSQLALADATVKTWDIGKDLETSYKTIYNALENNKFFVVFEPDIQHNLSRFAERWGNDYNRNKLEAIRAMVFCNGWYANQVSNADPDMLAMCPLHITLVQKEGHTRVLFIRPTVIAKGSKAMEIAGELEQDVSKALDEAVNELNK
jgi:uncharacterized protein (DUF302 family)